VTARVAFVIQRYGRGGAETLCQVVAEHLAARYDVTVMTTCALDHETWANHFPAGETMQNGVRLIRFPTASERARDFQAISARTVGRRTGREQELGWVRAQGPHSPALLEHLRADGGRYDAIFFVTYLYEPTVLGLPLVADHAALISTAHDEPPIHLSIYREVFTQPRWILYLAPAEKRMVQRIFANQRVPSAVCSWGLDAPPPADGERFRRKHGIDGDLVVYVGRVEGSKGCGELVESVRAHRRRRPITLALLGQNVMGIKPSPGILPLGFVDEQEKADALAAATVFVMPSAYESFSIVSLEAWQRRVPVLGNARSEVVKDHVRASRGGLYYEGPAEFSAALDYLLDRPALRERMGRNGERYVAENYAWSRVDATYDRVIADLAGGSRHAHLEEHHAGTR
jgi:glycosyltransferase involved in cell wall biosynthesis